MGSNGGDGGPSSLWPSGVSGTSYGAESEEDDSSKDGSLKESGNGDDMGNGTAGSDAEGVWSPDIEQSFQEALAIYPPCGRRKIILSDEGKMYGRNELIARYIKVRTGKTRTRKQVSSHIQVLARRKAREVSAKLKDHAAKEKALQSLTPAQISSLHNMQNKSGGMGVSHPGLHPHSAHPGHQMNHTSHVATAAAGLAALGIAPPPAVTPHFNWQPALTRDPDVKPSNLPANNHSNHANNHNNNNNNIDWEDGRCISSQKLRLVEFTSYVDSGPDTDRHLFVQIGGVNACYTDPLLEDIDLRQISDKFPASKGGLKDLYEKGPQDAFFLVKFWADLNIPNSLLDDPRPFYGVTSHFESMDRMSLCLSTKVCSFGKEAVEKVETIDCPTYVNGRYVYRLDRSEMCVYMVSFIRKLKELPEAYMRNSVLENFTVLLAVSNRDTNETLLCIAFVFEVSVSDNGAQHHIYRLVKPNTH